MKPQLFRKRLSKLQKHIILLRIRGITREIARSREEFPSVPYDLTAPDGQWT